MSFATVAEMPDDEFPHHGASSRPVAPLLSQRWHRRLIGATGVIVVALIAFTVIAQQSMRQASPGDDLAAWVASDAVALTPTTCTGVSGCDAPVLKADAGVRVRLGFRAGSPLSLTTEPTAGVFAAIDDDGWYLDTTDADGAHVIGVVGGDGRLWQFVLRVPQRG